MTSREKILAAVKKNQPEGVALPSISAFKGNPGDVVDKYITTLTNVGGKVHRVSSYQDIAAIVAQNYTADQRIITLVPELAGITTEVYEVNPDAHPLENVELAVLKAHFGVAENSAVWVTEDLLGHRALPFITQHLAVVVHAADIIDTMHEAYKRIGNETYGYGAFIAGPSKTADIEQSLVIGAHGPRSMTVFLMA